MPLTRDLGSPTLALSDGRPLPARYRGLRLIAQAGGRPVRAALLTGRRGQRLLERLPALRATYPDGRVFLISQGDRTYGRILFLDSHEPSTSEVIRKIVQRGDFALDVGANCGWFALLMASSSGADGEVWAFEPLPEALGLLHNNLSENPDLRIRVFESAVGEIAAQTRINSFAGLPHVHASTSTLGRPDSRTFPTSSVRLDEVLATTHRRPALVKVDVEGAELEVLRGSTRLVGSSQAPIWVLEVNYETSNCFGYRPRDLIEFLQLHGDYRPYRVTRRGLLQVECDAESAPQGGTWVCVPPGELERLDAAQLVAGRLRP